MQVKTSSEIKHQSNSEIKHQSKRFKYIRDNEKAQVLELPPK